MTDAQFCNLGGGAGNRILMALAAGLGVVERSEAVADLLDFLEYFLIGLMSRIVGDAVTFVVKADRRFCRRQSGCREDENQDGQRDQGSHSVFPFLRTASRKALLTEDLFSARSRAEETNLET